MVAANPKTTKRTPKKLPRRSPAKPLIGLGGIDSGRAYSLAEFRAITGMSRQKLSRLRRQENGPLIRDAGGTPMILGSDWLDFLRNQPQHVSKPRGPGGPGKKKADASVA